MEPPFTPTTAGMVIIGNEILSGKTQDINSPFLAQELRKLGVDLLRMATVPDQMEAIGQTVREMARQYSWVFTSGGVGPTHDDITYAAVAAGFGVPLELSPAMESRLKDHYQSALNESHLRMARLPQGSQVIEGVEDRFPPVRFNNVFILPGVPELFRLRFELIRPLLDGQPVLLRQVFLDCRETEIALEMSRVAEEHPLVEIGSYPLFTATDHSLKLTLECRQAAPLEAALDALLKGIQSAGVEVLRVA